MANRDKQPKEDKKAPKHTIKEKRQIKQEKKAAKKNAELGL
jgi:hypothetical protein